MFASCVGHEQNLRDNGFDVITIDPGMVDTSMQEKTRSKPVEELAMVGYFQQAYKDGLLQKPEKVAEKIFTILGNQYGQGKIVSVIEE